MTGERPWLGARIYRMLFHVLGPANVGPKRDVRAGPPDPQFPCPVCGQPMSEHTSTTSPGRVRTHCPSPPAADPAP